MKLYMSLKGVFFTITGLCLWVMLQMGISVYHQISDVNYYPDVIRYMKRIGQDLLVNHTIAELLLDTIILFTIIRICVRLFKQWFLTRKWSLYFSRRIHHEKTSYYTRKYRRWKVEIVIIRDQSFVALTMGIFRPKIIVSTGALELLNKNELHAVILHEIYHYLRKDPIKHLFITSFSDGMSYVPIIKQLAASYRVRKEMLADRFAIDHTGSSTDLGNALLKILNSNKRQHSAVGIGFAQSAVHYRIMQIVEPGNLPNVPVTVHWKSMLCSAVVLVSILLIVAINCT